MRRPTALLPALERWVLFVALLLSTGALIPLLRRDAGGEVDALEGDPLIQTIWKGVYAVVLLLALPRWKRFAYVASRDLLLLILLGIALLSVTWSAAPDVTLRRFVAVTGTTLLGSYLATRYELHSLLRFVACVVGATAVLSVLFAIALPQYGISYGTHAGAWRGVFIHKNSLGRMMALSALLFALLALSRPRRRWLAWGVCGLSIALVLLSTSKTALTLLLLLLLLIPLSRPLRWHYTLVVPVFLIALLVGSALTYALWSHSGELLQALGRDATLTGRTDIWSLAFESGAKRMWFGYGYRAFWLGGEGGSATIWSILQRTVGASFSHNGYLDLWLDLGVVGLGVFLLTFIANVRRAARWARLTGTADGLWPLGFFLFLFLSNLTESSLMTQHSIFWALYVALSQSLLLQHADRSATAADETAGLHSPVVTGGWEQAHALGVRRAP